MAKENSNSFVAAIVLGSSKVTGIVGRKEPEGIINVLAYVAIPSVDFINKGCVFNVEKMTTNLKTIRERLEYWEGLRASKRGEGFGEGGDGRLGEGVGDGESQTGTET